MIEVLGTSESAAFRLPPAFQGMPLAALVLCLASAVSVHAQDLAPLAGSWLFVPTNATQLALFAEVALEVTVTSPTAFVAALTWNSGDGTLVRVRPEPLAKHLPVRRTISFLCCTQEASMLGAPFEGVTQGDNGVELGVETRIVRDV
jgi:hypothetical protein